MSWDGEDNEVLKELKLSTDFIGTKLTDVGDFIEGLSSDINNFRGDYLNNVLEHNNLLVSLSNSLERLADSLDIIANKMK